MRTLLALASRNATIVTADGHAEQRAQLFVGFQTLGIITAIWLLTGPVWYLGSARSDVRQ